MTYKHFVFIAAIVGILGATVHAQIGPIEVIAGKKQPIAKVAAGATVTIKQTPQRGIVTQEVEQTSDKKIQIFYTANDVKESATDFFAYVVDANPEQRVDLQITPATFDFSRDVYDKIFKALFLLFFLAVVLESGLALLFNWRPFLETFNARATKPVVSFIFALIFVTQFKNLDLISAILNAVSTTPIAPSTTGVIITAMVLAGGSAGINNIMIALGFRQKRTPETVTPKPPKDKAWIAIKLDRVQAVGAVEVFIGDTPAATTDPLPLAGTIEGTSRPGIRFFFRDPGRFPPFAGHVVEPNHPLSFELRGTDGGGQTISTPRRNLTLAPGAIVDLEVRL